MHLCRARCRSAEFEQAYPDFHICCAQCPGDILACCCYAHFGPLPEEKGQAGFRIFGQQRLKRFGFNLQQNKDSQGGDVLSFNEGKTIIPLITNSSILTLRTHE
jgi:hypothetical protein